ncbi:SDR family NAD(P)-dependent oxidoreductase [Gammaproteobacteria bacterium]
MNQKQELSPIKRALLALQEMQAKVERLEREQRGLIEPIAVVAMACHFPGDANTPEAFWQLLCAGRDAITEVPAERWDVDAFYDPNPDTPGKMYTRYGSFLSSIEQFDPAFFGITPREANFIDPQHRLLLQVTWEALENGGFDINALHGSRTGVYVGISNFEYGTAIWSDSPTRITAYSGTGASLGVAAGRLSYTFGFTGPSMIIDTACSSSLVTTHLAMQALRLGECDLALSAGVNLIYGPQTHINFCKARMLATDGHCKTFSAAADGYARGEGIGVVVLKRLSDAERDGDTILALLRGSAVNQDGPSGGLTVPNGPSQVKVIRAALANGGITPDQVGYLEAHGTGTALGDPIEMGALGTVFGSRATRIGTPLRVASVKTNFGHLESAAGIAGLIKAILAVHHGQIPPHRNFAQPSPHIHWESLAVEIPTTLIDWPAPERIAGVSSFSFSGTNAHVLLSNYISALPAEDVTRAITTNTWPATRLLTLSAKTSDSLDAFARRVADDLRLRPDSDWHDYCVAAARGRGHYSHRLALLADSPAAAAAMLAAGEGLSTRRAAHPPRIAFLFTGQGAQYLEMGRQLYEQEPYFRALLDQCETIATPLLGRSLLGLLYPPPASATPEAEALLAATEYTQPLLFAIEYGLARLWQQWGIEPEALIGHSVGELVAATVAGLWTLEAGLTLTCARGQLVAKHCPPGAMIALPLNAMEATAYLTTYRNQAPGLVIAGINSSSSVTISGSKEEITAFTTALAAEGVEAKPLRVSHAFHSSLIEPMIPAFRDELARLDFATPALPIISNLTGNYADPATLTSPDYWCRHLREPVRFADGLARLLTDGFDTFIEIGPKPTLSAFGAIQAEAAGVAEVCHWLPSLRYRIDPWTQLLSSLGELYRLDVDAAAWALARSGKRYPLRLPNMSFQTQRYWLETPEPLTMTRTRGGHPLLGERLETPLLPTGGALFVNELSARNFLDHHQVFGQIVLPAAAHMEMALAAAAMLLPNGAWLREVTIHRALILPPDQPLPMQMVLEPLTGGYHFTIHARINDGWYPHTSGELMAGSSPVAIPVDMDASRRCCVEEVPVAEYYRLTHSVGIAHSAHFQALIGLWRTSDEVLARLELPVALQTDAAAFRLHPVLLDAAFQTASVLLLNRGVPYLPIGLEQLHCYRQSPSRLWCRAVAVTLPDPTESLWFVADLQLLDDGGAVIATVRGLRFQQVDTHAFSNTWRRYDQWLYQIAWETPPLFGIQPPALRSPARISADLVAATQAILPQCVFYQPLLKSLEQLTSGYIQQALQQNGWQPAPGEVFTTDGLARQLGVRENFLPLFERCLAILAEEGLLRFVGAADHWQVLTPLTVIAPTAIYRLRAEFPDGLVLITLLERCASVLAQVWRGEVDPLHLLFPQSDQSVTALFYQHSVGAKIINDLLASAVQMALVDLPASQRIRIIEIGGGTGGTTLHLLPLLPAGRSDYLFTDISPYFIHHAEQQFGGNYPFVRYAVLDIEKAPANELRGQFDIVIAANVLHATRSLGDTLQHCAALLVPGGMLVLLEAEARQRWLDLTFGMTDGWWRFKGHDPLRADYPLLSADQWREVLPKHGFDSVTLLGPDQYSETALLRQNILLAQRVPREPNQENTLPNHLAGNWLLIGDSNGCGAALAEHFTGRATVVSSSALLDAAACAALLAQPLQGIVLLHALEEIDDSANLSTPEALLAAQERICMPLLRLLQEMGNGRSSSLWVVTRDAIALSDGTTGGLAQATLHGLMRSVVVEYQQMRPVVVDLPPGESATTSAQRVWQELLVDAQEEQIVLRSNGRYVSRLRRYDDAVPLSPLPEIRADASYLISGGLGDLGLRVARYLVEQGARHLLLLGRSQPHETAMVQLAALQAAGATVEIAQIDVTDDRALQALLARPRPPLVGVVHAAGTLNDSTLAAMDWPRLASVLSAKVLGGWNLHQVTAAVSLDFFILFSSISSTLYSLGQGNYAAANAFLDQLAGYRRQRQLPALVINWGAWSEIGLAARQGVLTQVEQQGITTIRPDDGLALFDLLWRRNGQIIATAPIDWANFIRQLPRPMPLLTAFHDSQPLVVATPTVEATKIGNAWIERLRELPISEQREALLQRVREEVARVIGGNAMNLDDHTGFFDLGLDSLTAVELRNALQNSCAVTLPSTLLFKYPNIAALATFLATELLREAARPAPIPQTVMASVVPATSTATTAEVSAMSEAELEELINNEFNNLEY